MSFIITVIIANLVSLLCAGAAFYLAAHGQDGWGWFLFAALCCAASVKYKSTDGKDKEKKDDDSTST